MLKSYFFIPANSSKFISKIDSLASDYFILDMEDAISDNETELAFHNLETITIQENYYVRPRVFSSKNGQLDLSIMEKLLINGFSNFVIPKISEGSELAAIKDCIVSSSKTDINDIRVILLVENPKCLLNINNIIESNILNIVGLTLGSHDYTNVMGMKHTHENLNFSRHLILNTAKANNIEAIDIASMNIYDLEFGEECKSAFQMGYESKFILHPTQLKILKSAEYYSPNEVEEAKLVYSKILNMGSKDFSLVKINGKVFEKAHINRINNIIEWDRSR